jgi:hypothetical protein
METQLQDITSIIHENLSFKKLNDFAKHCRMYILKYCKINNFKKMPKMYF